MLRIVVVLLLGSVTTALASSTDSKLASISNELVVSDYVLGDFQQKKNLPFVATPFVSSGNFCLDRKSGLVWRVLQPVESTMLVKGDTVVLDGKRADDQGIGKMITTVMLGFMEGNLAGLKKIFDVSIDRESSGWSVSLKPKSGRLRAAIELVRIQGEHYLSSIEIVDAQQNRTLMEFSNVRSGMDGEMPCEELPR